MVLSRQLLTSLAAGVCVSLAVPAAAQPSDFNIPAGSLRSGLENFRRQSNRQLIYRSDDIEGLSNPGVRGQMPAEDALDALLGGTGLGWSADPSGSFAIVPIRTAGPSVSRPEQADLLSDPIVVTGTRIHATGTVEASAPASRSTSPIVSVSGDWLRDSGETSIGEVLNRLPPLRSTLTRSNSSLLDTGAGLSMLDLRGLGLNRTLVLQNGRRHIAGSALSSAVDVSTIPAGLIERVDIVTGGSSAIYGSDAVAGVVNFILKRDFEGLKLNVQRGTSSHGDAGQGYVDVVAGTNFADDRGNIAANVEIAHSDDWHASDRKYYREMSVIQFRDFDGPSDQNGSDGIPDRVVVNDVRGFSISNGGTFVSRRPGSDGYLPSYIFQPNGQLALQTGVRTGPQPVSSFIGGNGSNLREGDLFSMAPDTKRYSFDILAHLALSDAFEPFVEAKYVRIFSSSGSFGSFFSNGAWGAREAYRTDNPFLQPEARDLIRDELALGPGKDGEFFFHRNFAELGPVAQHNRRDTYRLVSGIRGRFGSNWYYEATANLARADSRTRFSGNVNVQRFLLAIDAVRDPLTGEIVCRSRDYPAARLPFEGAADAGYAQSHLARDVAECVPLNPFGEGNISSAARDYILEEGATSRSRVTQTVLNAYVTGDSRDWFELPAGPVELVAGAEYRRETSKDVQDDVLRAGLTHATALPPFEPGIFSTKEIFGELRAPLLKDVPLFDELTLSAAGRLADYRGNVGTVFAWNVGGQWVPTRGLRLRINRSTAIRAPNLVEANQPLGQNFSTTTIFDPCSMQSIGSGSSTRKANCLADGVPEGFDFVFSTSFPYLAGGNSDLREEHSDSLTFGAILQPARLAGFSLSLDYYRIGVDDVISTPDVQTVLDACYDAPSLDNAFCRLFDRHRGPGPGPGGESPGQIVNNSLHLQPFNFAAFKVSGLDVGVSYGAGVGGFGRFDAKLLYSLALRNDAFLDFDDAGRADQQLLELGNPRHALNWDIKLTRGIVSIEHQLRFFSRMSVDSIENIRSVQGRPPENEDAFSPRFFDSRTYHNIRVELSPLRHAELYFGIDNLTDQLPPPTLTGVDRGAIYDNVGRFFYAGATVRY
jgi:outer membrane receptor protein involved in Fe transport